MTTTDSKKSNSSHPLSAFTRLYDTEAEAIDVVIANLGRMAACARFAPTVLEEDHQTMYETFINIYDSLLEYRGKGR